MRSASALRTATLAWNAPTRTDWIVDGIGDALHRGPDWVYQPCGKRALNRVRNDRTV